MKRPDYSALAKILEEMNKEGGFRAATLSRDDGWLMAAAVAPTTNRDLVAAMSGHVSASLERTRNELELGELTDMSMRCSQGKFVVRKIAAKDKQSLLLAAIMPHNIRYHSRAIGKAATRIKRVLGYRH